VGEGVRPIETERLLLRPLEKEDQEELAEVLCDGLTMVWYPEPFTQSNVREWIRRQMERYPSGTGLMGMEEKRTGKLIGDCGAVWQEVEGRNELEIAYHVNRERWNLGFATEAAKAMIDYAFERLGVDHVISMIRPENVQSRRVAEKNGLTVNRMVFWHDYEHCVYQLWKK
jgi:[ribosomal protein S5]-alanine N-acetyltransferase